MGEEVASKLLELGFQHDVAHACSYLSLSVTEALKYAGRPEDQGNGFKPAWIEYFSIKQQRYYYVNKGTGESMWEEPHPLRLRDWILDAQLYNLDLQLCRIVSTLLLVMYQGSSWAQPQLLPDALQLVAKLVGNISQCGNTVEKYRTIKTDNPVISSKVLSLPRMSDLLIFAGFDPVGATLVFPADASPEALRIAGMVAAKALQLSGQRGFSGCATAVDDVTGSSSEDSNSVTGSTARHRNSPGFRFQQEIHECGHCSAPINDGSERLFSGLHDAPKGEFRYECSGCSGYSLCEKCWDKRAGGDMFHSQDHTFRTHHPRASRHFMYGTETDSNPWGQFAGGGISARSRQRLTERTGL